MVLVGFGCFCFGCLFLVFSLATAKIEVKENPVLIGVNPKCPSPPAPLLIHDHFLFLIVFAIKTCSRCNLSKLCQNSSPH